jgi:nodulation protein E
MGNAAASHVGMRYGCTGPTLGVTSACASASQAIGLGIFMIRARMVDRAIVGGSDSTITALNIRAWELLHVLTPDCPRPFSIGRNGMVLGEGAAVFVLESAEAARARSAEPLAELAGFGTSSDAGDLVRLDVDGPASAMRLALADAGLAPDAIDYVNAHGSGTIANDINEAQALRQVFGDRVRELPVSSTKPIHGHTLGAAGAIELAVTVMALREGVVPPTINWLGPDPKVDLDPVPNVARAAPIRAAMSNSFAFGGINGCLIVAKAP